MKKKSLDNRGTYSCIFSSAPYMKDKYATCEMIMLTCDLFMSACVDMKHTNVNMQNTYVKLQLKLCCMPT